MSRFPSAHRPEIYVEVVETPAGEPPCGNGSSHAAGTHQRIASCRVELTISFVEFAHIDMLRAINGAIRPFVSIANVEQYPVIVICLEPILDLLSIDHRDCFHLVTLRRGGDDTNIAACYVVERNADEIAVVAKSRARKVLARMGKVTEVITLTGTETKLSLSFPPWFCRFDPA